MEYNSPSPRPSARSALITNTYVLMCSLHNCFHVEHRARNARPVVMCTSRIIIVNRSISELCGLIIDCVPTPNIKQL